LHSTQTFPDARSVDLAEREPALAFLCEGAKCWESYPYAVGGTKTTTRMYACPSVDSLVSIVRADRNTPGFVRAPPEVPYMFALESAMDERAHELKMNPIELRRVNDTMKEPIKGLPYP
jgi:CO/xanthine dehydrogenase Mo-binding subunit